MQTFHDLYKAAPMSPEYFLERIQGFLGRFDMINALWTGTSLHRPSFRDVVHPAESSSQIPQPCVSHKRQREVEF